MKKINTYKKPILITAISLIAILGLNSAGQVGSRISQYSFLNNVNSQSTSTPKDLHDQEIKDVAMNDKETFVIFTDVDGTQSLMHWGSTNGYQKSQKLDIPLEEGDTLTNVYADFNVAFAVVEKADGTNSVYGYGDNSKKQITQDATGEYTTPVLVKDGIQLSDITINKYTTSIYYQDGTDLKVLSQGDNRYFGLGTDDKSLTTYETTVAASTLVNADAGTAHTAAILDFTDDSKDGVYAWGLDGNGQIGDGQFVHPEDGGVLPVKVEGLNDATGIYAGGNNTFATKPNGGSEKIYGWGAGMDYQLGTQTGKSETKPLELTKLEDTINNAKEEATWNVVQMHSGNDWSVLFVDRGGSIERYVWGNQKDGKLGNGVTDDTNTDFQLVEEVTQGGESISKDQFVAFDGNSDTILKALELNGFNLLEGFGGNTNGALSATGGSENHPKPTKIYEESQLKVNGITNNEQVDPTKIKFDVAMDSNIVDAASFNFAIKQGKTLIDSNNVKVDGINRTEGKDTIISFEVTTPTTDVENAGKTLNYSISVDGEKGSFENKFTVSFDLLDSSPSVIDSVSISEESQNTVKVHTKIKNTTDSSIYHNATATKIDVVDSEGNNLYSESLTGDEYSNDSFEKDFTITELKAGTTYNGAKIIVTSTYGSESTEGTDEMDISSFTTLVKKDSSDLTEEDFVFKDGANSRNEHSYSYTIKGQDATPDTFGREITKVEVKGDHLNGVDGPVEIDAKTPTLENGEWKGDIYLSNLIPETTYSELKLDVTYQNTDDDAVASNLVNERTVVYKLNGFTTSNYDAPKEPVITMTPTEDITSANLDWKVEIPEADHLAQRPTKITSISYKNYEASNNPAPNWKNIELEGDGTTEQSGTITLDNLKASTTYKVEFKVEYSDTNGSFAKSTVDKEIEFTTKPKKDQTEDPEVIVNTPTQLEGDGNDYKLSILIDGTSETEDTKPITITKASILIFDGQNQPGTGTPKKEIEVHEDDQWSADYSFDPLGEYTLFGKVQWESGDIKNKTTLSDPVNFVNKTKSPSQEPDIEINGKSELTLGNDAKWRYDGYSVKVPNDDKHLLTTVKGYKVTVDNKIVYENIDSHDSDFTANATFDKEAFDFNKVEHKFNLEVYWIYNKTNSDPVSKTSYIKNDVNIQKLEDKTNDPRFRVEYANVKSVSSTQSLISYKISKKYSNATDLIVDNSSTSVYLENTNTGEKTEISNGADGSDPFEGTYIIDGLESGKDYSYIFSIKYKLKYPEWAPDNNYISEEKNKDGIVGSGNNTAKLVTFTTLEEGNPALASNTMNITSYDDNVLRANISFFNAPSKDVLSGTKLRVKENDSAFVEKNISFTKVESGSASRNATLQDMDRDEYSVEIQDVKADTIYTQWEISFANDENGEAIYNSINLVDETGNIIYNPSTFDNTVVEVKNGWKLISLIAMILTIILLITTIIFTILFLKAKKGGAK